MIFLRFFRYFYDRRKRLVAEEIRKVIAKGEPESVDGLLEIDRIETVRSVFRARLFRAVFLGVFVLLILNFVVNIIANVGIPPALCSQLLVFSFAFYWLYLRTLPLVLTLKHYYAILVLSDSHDPQVITLLIKGLNTSLGGLPFGPEYTRIANPLVSQISELAEGSVVYLDSAAVNTICVNVRRAWWGYGGMEPCFRVTQALVAIPGVAEYPEIRRLLEQLTAEPTRYIWETELQKLFRLSLEGHPVPMAPVPHSLAINFMKEIDGRNSSNRPVSKTFAIITIVVASMVLGPLTGVLASVDFSPPAQLQVVLGTWLYLSYICVGVLSAYMYISGSRTLLQRRLLITIILFMVLSIMSSVLPLSGFTTVLPRVAAQFPWRIAVVWLSSFLFLICLTSMSFSWCAHSDHDTNKWRKMRYLVWP